MRFLKPNLQAAILSLAALYFLVVGGYKALQPTGSNDFVPVYCAARCMLSSGCNPYDISDLQMQYIQAGGKESDPRHWENTPSVYPPSSFLAIFPFALFKCSTARLLWLLLNASLFILSFLLVLSFCPQPQQWIVTILGLPFLHHAIILLGDGQPAAFAISSLIISTVLFLRSRYLSLAALLLMLSLAVKPQIGALVVLFLLIRKGHRLYVAFAATGALALLLLGGWILNQRPQSADWVSQMRANIAVSLQPGHVNDPTSPTGGEVNLQGVTQIMFSDEKVSGAVSYVVFGILLVAWGIAALRTNSNFPEQAILIAALLVLTLLPVYHRFYDELLLLLTIPAVPIIFERHRRLGFLIILMTILGNFLIEGHVYRWFANHPSGTYQHMIDNKILFILLMRLQNIALLLLACLYIVAIFVIQKKPTSGFVSSASNSTQVAHQGDVASLC